MLYMVIMMQLQLTLTLFLFNSACRPPLCQEKFRSLVEFSGGTDFRALCFIRWMYWTDWEEDPKESKRGRIERAWMDGSNRNVFLSSKTVLWPNGLSLDIPQGILYWVDAYYDRIEMVYLNSSERKVST